MINVRGQLSSFFFWCVWEERERREIKSLEALSWIRLIGIRVRYRRCLVADHSKQDLLRKIVVLSCADKSLTSLEGLLCVCLSLSRSHTQLQKYLRIFALTRSIML